MKNRPHLDWIIPFLLCFIYGTRQTETLSCLVATWRPSRLAPIVAGKARPTQAHTSGGYRRGAEVLARLSNIDSLSHRPRSDSRGDPGEELSTQDKDGC